MSVKCFRQDITFAMLNLMQLYKLWLAIDSILRDFKHTFYYLTVGCPLTCKKVPLFEFEVPVFRKPKAADVELPRKYDR
jgi:hypothetical protein